MSLYRSVLLLALCVFIVALNGQTANAQKEPTGQSTNTSGSTRTQPVLLELKPYKDLYYANNDIMIKAHLWATQPVSVCIYPSHPEANFAVDIYRSGYGKLDVAPQVVQLTPKDMARMQKINLEPGQSYQLGFNLKKLVQAPPTIWKTGEYRIQAKFSLCDETDIPSQGPLHLLILE